MNETLKRSAELFFDNLEIVKEAFPWENTNIKLLCAMVYSAKGTTVDISRMKKAEEIIREKTHFFSQFRGDVKLMLAVQMAGTNDMEAYYDHVRAVYDRLIAGKKLAMIPEQYIVAAMVIAQAGEDSSAADEEHAAKTKSVYDRMKENHPLLTGDEDLGFAAMLAMSGVSVDAAADEMERCYQLLRAKKLFGSFNGVQSLSHVLSLEVGNAEEKCDRTAAIYEGLKAKKKHYGVTHELSTLGAFAFADADSGIIVDEISEVDDYLKTNKNFSGLFAIEAKQRLMFAAILVMQQHCSKGTGAETAALAGTLSMIAAEQAAIMAMITSSITISSMSSAHA